MNTKKNKKKKIKINWKEVGKSLNKHKKGLIISVISIIIIILLAVMITNLVTKQKYDEDATPYDSGSTLKATEFNKILDHKKDIDNVYVEERTVGKVTTRPIDNEKAYKIISEMKVIERTEERDEENATYYIFTMKDGTIYNIEFEGKFLRSEDVNYVVELPSEE